MASKYYKKHTGKTRQIIRFGGLSMALLGALVLLYTLYPLLTWELYAAPVFAAQNVNTPIPKVNVLTSVSIQSLIQAGANSLLGVDYTNATNWFPSKKTLNSNAPVTYLLSIPKLNIKDALVSNKDGDLTKHLVHFANTSLPPQKGNAVILGHSTLPQLFNPKDYKTIFANALQMTIGDKIEVNIEGITYTYKVFRITIIDPTDTSVLAQDTADSYLTIITCTPPGTVWKRLVIKARLQKLNNL